MTNDLWGGVGGQVVQAGTILGPVTMHQCASYLAVHLRAIDDLGHHEQPYRQLAAVAVLDGNPALRPLPDRLRARAVVEACSPERWSCPRAGREVWGAVVCLLMKLHGVVMVPASQLTSS